MPNDQSDVVELEPIVEISTVPGPQCNNIEGFIIVQKAIFGESSKEETAHIPNTPESLVSARWVPFKKDYAIEVRALTGFGRLSWLMTTREDIDRIFERGIEPDFPRLQVIIEQESAIEEQKAERKENLAKLTRNLELYGRFTLDG